MKTLRQFCAGIALTIAFAIPAFAGQIDCGVVDPPPPPQPTATATGEMLQPIVDAVMVALSLT